MRFWPISLTLLLATVAAGTPASAQSAHPPFLSAAHRPVQVTNAALRASLLRIARGSALWRHALGTLSTSGRQIVVLAADQVIVPDGSRPPASDGFDDTLLAEAAPIAGANGEVHVVVVVVNVSLLEHTHRTRGSLPIEFESDLDRILVHEIYGHAIPYLIAGHVSARCADPVPGERAANACSIQRENLVRAELGLGRRTDSGLDSLAIARRDRH